MARKRAAKEPQELEHVDDAWTYTCRVCGFTSAGWPSRNLANARRRQHLEEHTHRVPMPELKDGP